MAALALGPGSIAFTGFNADGFDNLAFLAIDPLPAGTVLYFADNEWNGAGWVDANESTFSLTLTADVAAGTIVTIDNINNSAVPASSNAGTVAAVPSGGSNRGISNENETVYVYLADAATPLVPTVFLSAVANDGFVTANGVLTGTGLVEGETALNLGALDSDLDIAVFTGSRSNQSDLTAYRALLNTPANWAFQDASGDQSIDGIAPDVPFDTTAFTTGGTETQSVGFTTTSLTLNEGNSGTTSFSFVVTRAGGLSGDVAFSGIISPNTTDDADYVAGVAPVAFSGTIPAGQASFTVVIDIAGDAAIESDEGFTLTLTSATNTAGVTTTVNTAANIAAGTVTNDDAPAPTLGAGAIAFVGFNADGNDDVAFVALAPISAGTTIYFSDREWVGTAFNTGEGEVAFTATSDIAAGTVVTIADFGTAPSSAHGTLTGASGLSSSTEILYAYVGLPNIPSAFLAAVANGGFTVDGATLDGTGLVIGETAIDLSALGGSPDIAAYVGDRAGAESYADYAAVINTAANWVGQDATGDQHLDGTNPDLPFDATMFTIDDTKIGGIAVYDALPSLAGSVSAPVASDDIVLVRLGAHTGSGTTAAGRAESLSIDAATNRVFVTNAAQAKIDVAQINADGTFTAHASIDLAGLTGFGGVNSVAVKNGVVAVAYQNIVADQPGYVALFDAATGALAKLVTVGVLPDQLTFTPDGTRILVANEGETVTPTNNPAGSISIIDLSAGAASAMVSNVIGFDALNGAEAELLSRGLALFAGQDAGDDIEPEYITVSPDGTRAYVTLQEVNAVAVIDLTDPSATKPVAIQALGGVDRTLAGNAFDGSDRNGISLVNADVISLLQPDAIASYEVDGVTYFITANEGDARVGGLGDEARLNNAAYVLDPTAYPNAAALKTDAVIGRLNVLTNIGDTDGDGDIDQIYTFGGRSITIFRQEADGTITKVRETGGEFEAILARDFPAAFNGENGGSFDGRSDNKGPEPEGVTIGQVGERVYAFISLERIGGVMVYDVTDPANATFVSYRPVTAQDYAPETIAFIGAGTSPTGDALVLTANEVSGTTTLYRAVAQTDNNDVITGAGDADTFNGRAGDDIIAGLGGNDVLTGGAGNDRIDGGEGTDTARYDAAETGVTVNLRAKVAQDTQGAGIDHLIAIENVAGSAFDDLLRGNDGANTLTGLDGNDTLLGMGGADMLLGGAGDDRLVGGDGDDVLIGGAGFDAMTGGAGADRFVFAAGDFAAPNADRISDFDTALDVIDLRAIAGLSFIGTDAFGNVAGQVRYTAAAKMTTVSIDLDGNGTADASIRLTGALVLAADDFLL